MSDNKVRDILDERVTAFKATTTVDEAVRAIRESATDSERTIYYAFCLGDDDTLDGVVSLRELLNADGDRPVSDVATPTVVAVSESDPVRYAGKLFSKHRFMALPVVDETDSLVGIVRPESVIEALDEEETKEVLRTAIKDVDYDPAEESLYECFTCGATITAVNNPVECPKCGGDVRHTRTPLE